ncbi:MAG: flagellar basal body L-ring protein FlgH [Deltaproteobacteria bacterium]|nr:flagellar basal body L-ring protein FlgH [Deltaproteobacteria bacterium]
MKKENRFCILCLLVLVLVQLGCAERPPVRDRTKFFGQVPEPVLTLPERQYPGSLWQERNSESILFMDHKASQVNDIVTVQIVETVAGTGVSNSKYEKETELGFQVDALLGLPQSLGMNNFLGLGEPFQPGVKGKSVNDFEGKGQTRRSGTLSGTITCRVVEVFQNGNMEIRGSREVTLNREQQFIVLSGVIRQEDITSFNTIRSDNVADARIEYYGEGILADKESPGWLARVLDWVWPF